jgi:hypothetical protein
MTKAMIKAHDEPRTAALLCENFRKISCMANGSP